MWMAFLQKKIFLMLLAFYSETDSSDKNLQIDTLTYIYCKLILYLKYIIVKFLKSAYFS
jgi:hypothetical protein